MSNPYLTNSNDDSSISQKTNLEDDFSEVFEDEKKESTKKNKSIFSIEITPVLNRGIIHTYFVSGHPITVCTSYDKKTALVQFQIDGNCSVIKNRIVHVNMFRNLSSSVFAKLFLDLKDDTSDKEKDIRYRLAGLKPLYSRYLIQFMKEQYDFQINEKNRAPVNVMYINGWKIMDVDNELLFLLVQRRYYMDIGRINVGRSYGIQLASDKGLECLNRYYEDFEKNKKNFMSENN